VPDLGESAKALTIGKRMPKRKAAGKQILNARSSGGPHAAVLLVYRGAKGNPLSWCHDWAMARVTMR
jgi:hypothetical protein